MSFGPTTTQNNDMLDGLFGYGDRTDETPSGAMGPAAQGLGFDLNSYYAPSAAAYAPDPTGFSASAAAGQGGPGLMSPADYRPTEFSQHEMQPSYMVQSPSAGGSQTLYARRNKHFFDPSALSPHDSWSSSGGFDSMAEASDEVSPMRPSFRSSMGPPSARRVDLTGQRRAERGLSIMPGLLYGQDNPFLSLPTSANSIGSGTQYQTVEEGRMRATLHASTAMVKSPEEIPLTYLNKSQAYVLSIQVVQPPVQQRDSQNVTYRSTIKILFDEQDSQTKVANYWKLWRDGRGITEAIERNAEKVRAIECDAAASDAAAENLRRNRHSVVPARIVAQAFDGFTIEWQPDQANNAINTLSTAVAIRCHFLSTDFSHSKGVRGVTLRLAVQTEEVVRSRLSTMLGSAACTIKLFRDKGAERKSSNDLTHVRKAIQKLQAAIGSEESPGQKQAKARRHSRHNSEAFPRHEREQSVSSDDESLGSPGGNSRNRMYQLENMMVSMRPFTAINLPLEAHADMQLSLAEEESLKRALHNADAARAKSRPYTGAALPLPSSSSDVGGQQITTDQARSYNPAYEAVIRPGASFVSDANKGMISALGVDSNYRPPATPSVAPIKVVYVLPVGSLQTVQSHQYASPPLSIHSPALSEGELRPWTAMPYGSIDSAYHHAAAAAATGSISAASTGMVRQPTSQPSSFSSGATYTAIYLTELTSAAFARALSRKLGLAVENPRCVRENPQGLRIVVDDDFIANIRDSQAMTCELRRKPAAAGSSKAVAAAAAAAAMGAPSNEIELVLRWQGL